MKILEFKELLRIHEFFWIYLFLVKKSREINVVILEFQPSLRIHEFLWIDLFLLKNLVKLT